MWSGGKGSDYLKALPITIVRRRINFWLLGGGIVTDYGIGSIKNGANKVLAKTATQKLTSTYLAYDRTNPDNYARGADVIKQRFDDRFADASKRTFRAG